MYDDTRQTARVWEADLGEVGRKLTLDELTALEQMHICHLLARVTTALEEMGLHLSSLEGRMDRLEVFLSRIDSRYPRSAQTPLPALPRVDEPSV